MQISTRFSIAVHILLCAAVLEDKCKLTSEFLAASAGVNPVVVRKISSQLKKAGLLNVPAGTGGASLARGPEAISLYDVYAAVESVAKNSLFNMHERPNPACAVGRSIEPLLNAHMEEAQKALESSLKNKRLSELAAQVDFG
jgi:DNA-binding IscR family transcriptional regulator